MNESIGINEIKDTIQLRKLWLFWGWLDIRQRYRRSFLGPLWVTMTMGVSILATGLVYAFLFKQEVANYLPYVAAGFVLWSLISGYIGEACSVFIQNEGFINQLNLPFLIYPIRLLWRYIIMFMHHMIILGIVLMLFTPLTITSLLAAILGLFLVCLNLFWIGLVLGLISVRLRDLPILVSTIFQVMFLITPVIWPVSALGNRMIIAMWNPFYHLIEVVRTPLLYGITSLWGTHLIVSATMAFFGLGIGFVLLSAWKRRLVFWL